MRIVGFRNYSLQSTLQKARVMFFPFPFRIKEVLLSFEKLSCVVQFEILKIQDDQIYEEPK